jgi:hypothetical protein
MASFQWPPNGASGGSSGGGSGGVGSAAKILYVSGPGGSDSTGSGSFTAPYASLGKAVSVSSNSSASPGEIVILNGITTDVSDISTWPAATSLRGQGKYISIVPVNIAYAPTVSETGLVEFTCFGMSSGKGININTLSAGSGFVFTAIEYFGGLTLSTSGTKTAFLNCELASPTVNAGLLACDVNFKITGLSLTGGNARILGGSLLGALVMNGAASLALGGVNTNVSSLTVQAATSPLLITDSFSQIGLPEPSLPNVLQIQETPISYATAAYDIGIDTVLFCDASGGAFPVNLPSFSTSQKIYTIVNQSSIAVTITAQSGELINNGATSANTLILATKGAKAQLMSDGTTGWWVIG